ncbi:unnamed protein product [Mytilus coruscus]|nr:unnamed protein product [Mytilus coruscus]
MCLLYHFLHHSRTGLSRGLLALYFSKACMFVRDASNCCYSSENKQQYFKYKYDLSHLLIGVHSDAVSGWMRLASFFYVRKNYFASLSVINYTLQKYTGENRHTKFCIFGNQYKYFQKNELYLMKKEKFYTVYKTLKISPITFSPRTSIIPQELQLKLKCYVYNPLQFGHFLSFLCHYHLHDITSCTHYLQQMRSGIRHTHANVELVMFSAISHQLLGETNVAKEMFQRVAEVDEFKHSGALTRLKLLSDI